MNTNEAFKQLLKEKPYSIKEISLIIETSYETVRNWTRDEDSTNYRVMPNYALIAVTLSIEEIERIGE